MGDDAFVRTFVPGDAEILYALVDANRDRLRPWMPWEETTRSPADTRAFIERSIAAEDDMDANGIWVGGELVGSIGMRIDTVNGGGEIGYWVTGPFEGRGLVTRACRLFVEDGFGRLGLHRITIRAGVENVRSRAIPERLGFTYEGTMRESGRTGGGAYVDLAIYGLLEGEPITP
jgi:ribosomal-protein-serine acetyltransferase